MARAIDCEIAKKRLQAWIDESEAQGFEEAARNFRDCISLLDAVPTLTLPNEPLTIEQLREMDKITPVWWTWNGCWCLCERGYITTPNGDVYGADEMNGLFYRRPPEGENA